MIINCVVVGLLFAMSAFPVNAEDKALQALLSGLGDAIHITQTPHPAIQYCPENTCDEFRGGHGKQLEDVADFALLYLWYISDYTVLERWRQQSTPTEVQASLARHGSTCSETNEHARVVCALRRLAGDAGIQVFFVRYDEGQVNVERVDLDTELNRFK
jgi:hypothetical protein